MVGLIQEQHPERCALFLQWKQMDFPILVDSLNRIGVSAVPLFWAVDEHGVLRSERPTMEWLTGEFLATEYPPPAAAAAPPHEDVAVGHFLAGEWDQAVERFGYLASSDRKNALNWFRLGCAFRARHDSDGRRASDFQRAVAAWTRALDLDPSNYIWRRRLQQYGPTLDKPYPFYDWVPTARAEISARGEAPHPLGAEPEGSELAQAVRDFAAAPALAGPDPEGRLPRDDRRLVAFTPVLAPTPVRPGQAVRVYLYFEPNAGARVHWSNDAGLLQAWVGAPEGWTQSASELSAPLPEDAATSSETRLLELELRVPADAPSGIAELRGYATYYVCEDVHGECVYLRRDIRIRVPVNGEAVPPRSRR
ncbi:MAG TPA: hypothetical protein VGC54_12240 [Planctomycetota bacterium]